MAGIYIHFPFCKSKCIYCNFYSVARTSLIDNYINALCDEIRLKKDFLNGEIFKTIYFGGGTPSLLAPRELERVINTLYRELSIHPEIEFTLEANPEQLSFTYLSDIKNLGINRLSIGVQSFHDHILKLLRRKHNADTAKKAIDDAQHAGFDNISIDLIYGVIERSEEEWKEEISIALAYPITHLSAYALTVEENTLLSKKIQSGNWEAPPDEKAIADYLILQKKLAKSGFKQYEISNYARNEMISKHNFNYWQNIPYLGLGASAHSYDLQARYWNVADIEKYIRCIEQNMIPAEKERLSVYDHYNEFILLGLRTSKGINLNQLRTRFDQSLYNLLLQNIQTIDRDLYQLEGDYLYLTEEGKLFADHIAAELFYCEI